MKSVNCFNCKVMFSITRWETSVEYLSLIGESTGRDGNEMNNMNNILKHEGLLKD